MKNPFVCFVAIFLLSSYTVLAQAVENRSLPDFNKINVGGSWNVTLKPGERNEVRLEAKNLSLDKVITEVKNNRLDIRLEKGNYRNVDLEVTVTYKELVSIHSGGSGNLKSTGELVADNLEINLSGSGNASFNHIVADKLSLTMSGSGDMAIKGGAVGALALRQSGSGNLKAMDLVVEEAELSKSGSGDSAVTVNRTLSVNASGSGNVQYKGNPSMNDIRISGSGRVVKK